MTDMPPELQAELDEALREAVRKIAKERELSDDWIYGNGEN